VQRHTTYVVAPPDRILDTILSGALAGAWLDEDRLMRALVALRFALDRLTKPGGGSHRSNSSFSLQSFTFLGRQDDREIAIGLAGRFWRLTGPSCRRSRMRPTRSIFGAGRSEACQQFYD